MFSFVLYIMFSTFLILALAYYWVRPSPYILKAIKLAFLFTAATILFLAILLATIQQPNRDPIPWDPDPTVGTQNKNTTTPTPMLHAPPAEDLGHTNGGPITSHANRSLPPIHNEKTNTVQLSPTISSSPSEIVRLPNLPPPPSQYKNLTIHK